MLDWARRIVGDTRAMRQEVHALKHGLAGRLAYRRDSDHAGHDRVADHALSRTASRRAIHGACRATRRRFSSSWKISRSMPVSPISTMSRSAASPTLPLYRERYRLLTAADAPLGNRDKVTWAEVAQVPLCLLTPDMQNPPHHRGLLRERRRRSAADAGIEFDDPALLACAHRPLGERHAGAARRDTWPHRRAARHSHRRARKRATRSAWWCRRASR